MINCKFNIPENEKRAIWSLTDHCNYGCRYCIFSSGSKYPKMPLSLEHIKGIMLDLKQNGFTQLKFTGGEPFLRPDILSILDAADAYNFKFDVSTNASSISSASAAFLSKLRNLTYIHVGMDGFDQLTQEAIRGKDTYEPTIDGIRKLISADVPVRIGCVITKFNQYSIARFLDSMTLLGVKKVSFSLVEPVGRMARGRNIEPTRSKDELALELSSLKPHYSITISDNFNSNSNYQQPQCPAGSRFIHIDPNGMLTPCPWISEYSDFNPVSTLSDLKHIASTLSSIPECPAATRHTAIRWLQHEKI